MQTFTCKPQIFFGAYALGQLSACRYNSVLLVTDPFFQTSGVAEMVLSKVPAKNKTIFSQVTPDPTTRLVAEALAVLDSCRPDLVIALGGGSPIDCAKAMIFAADYRPFFVAIPTTSGTGSEVTSFSIVTHQGAKYPLVDCELVPDWAILDDSLVEKLPPSLVADAGFDVLVHALEALASTDGSHFTNALASSSFQLTYDNLLASFRGDTACRGTIHQAATMAGMAFDQAGLGICHSLAHALGGAFHVPHGRLNAILIPAVLQFNNSPVYGALASQCGIGATTRSLSSGLIRLRNQLKLAEKLSQVGISHKMLIENLGALTKTALADPCSRTNPRTATEQDLAEILKQVM